MQRLGIFVLCVALYVVTDAETDTLDRVNKRFKATDVLQSFSETVEEGFRNRVERARSCSCSPHVCSNTLDSLETCTTRLGSSGVCGEGCTTRKVSLQQGFVSTPPGTDPKRLAPAVAQDSCIYQSLDKAFMKFESTVYSWIYYATVGGVSINYPGVPSPRGLTDEPSDELLGHCEQYDPRMRPWYSDATSAPKDIVILMDSSSSMETSAGYGSSQTRWELAKEVANNAIDLLHFADAVRLVFLGDQESILIPNPGLLEATETNKMLTKGRLEEMTASGEQRIEDGLKTAFHTFRRAQSEEIKSTRCQQVILWITDGNLCRQNGTHGCPNEHERIHGVLSTLDKEQATLEPSSVGGKASIFVITVGHGIDSKLPRLISCRHNGTYSHINPGGNVIEQMAPYIGFFAGQLRENEARIVWSRFYEDFSGLGIMTTATRPIFSHGAKGSKKGKLVGVIGFDIPLSTLEENGLRYSDVVGQLSRHIGQCTVYPIDQCQLQLLRGREMECPEIHPKAACYADSQTGRVYYSSIGSERHWTFDEARQSCANMNGRLAEIRSADDQAFLSSLVSLDAAWIGLKMSKDGTKWKWLSGKERNSETIDTFWARNDIADTEHEFCAAMDARGTQRNIEPRVCTEELEYVCEFQSIQVAPEACTSDLHLIDRSMGNKLMASIDTCLTDMNHTADDLDASEIARIRNSENNASVFCPMELEKPVGNAEAICCERCLDAMADSLTTADEDDTDSDEVAEETDDLSAALPVHSLTLFLSLSFSLPFILLVVV